GRRAPRLRRGPRRRPPAPPPARRAGVGAASNHPLTCQRGDEVALDLAAAAGPGRDRGPGIAPRPSASGPVGAGRLAQPASSLTTSTMSWLASVGFWPTRTPAARRASILAWAVPLPPETMAPAWPIFLPGGAVTPAM